MHHILLVEDEAIIAVHEQNVLESAGFAVSVAHSGETAIATFQSSIDVDLVLVDIDLGDGIDGTETARRIQDIREVPIVFLTSHHESEYVARADEVAGYGYVLKGTDEFMLVQSIRTAMKLFAAHRRTHESEKRFRRLFENAPHLSIQGYTGDGTVVFWNSASEAIYGYTAEEAIGRNILDLIIPVEMHEAVRTAIRESADTGIPIPAEELTLLDKDRNPVDVYSRHAVVPLSDGATELYCLDQDIGPRKHAEAELRRREKEYRILVENQSELIVRVDAEGRFDYVSDTYCRLFGKARSELIGRSFVPLVHEDDRAATMHAMERLYRPPYECRLEQRAMTKDGWRWLEWDDKAVLDEDGAIVAIVGAGRDITDRKDAELKLCRSEERLRGILNALPVPVVVHSVDGDAVEMVNAAFAGTFGYDGETIGTEDDLYRLILPDASYRARILEEWDAATRKADGVIGPLSVEVTCRDGSVRVGRTSGYRLDDVILVVFTDLTEITKVQRKLERSVIEKERLMMELNHRVKNNLMLVSALVSLKDENLGRQADLSDIRSQIDAIGLIHEKLYVDDDTGLIDFSNYVTELLDAVFSFYGDLVTVENDIEPGLLGSGIAVTLGVIINELATNAMKHAFQRDTSARFCVAMRIDAETDEVELVVENNGRRFPGDIDLDNPSSLGLQLVTSLVQQLRGTITLVREPTTIITIRFRLPASSIADGEESAPGAGTRMEKR